MAAAQFPYEKSFIDQLTADGKHPQTITQYQLTLSDFFNYEQHFNDKFAQEQLLIDITENDIQQYLTMLKSQRQFKTSTLNKALSNLNGYFSFLFEHRLITTLPTFSIKGQPIKNDETNDAWPEQLANLLANDDLHVYTRLFLLLTCKSYEATEMLAPDFYHKLHHIEFARFEQVFLEKLQTFLRPLQARTGSHDLFLKTRQRGQDPHLTLAALHKYLSGDGQRLGMPLKPVALRQSFVLWYLDQHRTTEPEAIMTTLRLDFASLAYYQNLLRKQDIRSLQTK